MDNHFKDQMAAVQKLNAATKQAESQAHTEHRRTLELRSSFYDKLAALDAGSIAVAVSVGIALLGKIAPHSPLLHANFGWLVAIGASLWLSLVCAIGHNAIFIRIAHLEADKANQWSKWISLLNASSTCAITGTASIGEPLNKLIIDTFDDRIKEDASNQHHTEQSARRLKFLGTVAICSFLIAYTLIFAAILRLWFLTR